MFRRIILGLALSIGLVACGQSTPPAMTDPFAELTPWDAAREGVVTTESGLQYFVVKEASTDAASPGANDRAVVNYDGRLAADGTKFDSSYDRGTPSTFGVSQVIPGWTEALKLMKPGDEWMLYIPANLAYGAAGRPTIPPNSDLIFRVELLEVEPDASPSAEFFNRYTPWNSDAEGVQTTESGLEYVELNSGPDGGASPSAQAAVIANYEGRLASTGVRFDSSYARGEPAMFGVGGVIAGWTEILQLMTEGDDWLVYIPSDLGYGAGGTPGGPIPPDADLIFRIDLNTVLEVQTSDAEAWETLTPWNSEGSDVQKTDSGLEYVVLASGPEDGTSPTRADRVVVYYEGRLAETGETFDSAYARGESIDFGVTQVIPGWTEALQLMRPGDRWLVYLPADIAYGAAGRPPTIPENSDLIFEVQLMAVL